MAALLSAGESGTGVARLGDKLPLGLGEGGSYQRSVSWLAKDSVKEPSPRGVAAGASSSSRGFQQLAVKERFLCDLTSRLWVGTSWSEDEVKPT